REDGKETLWIPAGLMIRIDNQDGTIHRIRIRRPSWAREKFLPDLKYVWIEGSGNAPMVIRPQGQSRGVVVVEAELDAMAVAAAHQAVTVIALGSVSTGLPPEIKAEIAAAAVILLALDADPGKDGKPGAGPAAIAAWRHEFRQAKFWPVPAGKDPGDYVKNHSGNLRAWVEAGLIPPAKASEPPAHDAMSIPVGSPAGGEGEENTTPKKEHHDPLQFGRDHHCPETAAAHAPDNTAAGQGVEKKKGTGKASGCHIVTLTDGREIHVVRDEQSWKALAAQGFLVFSENEMKRLQVAMAGCSEDARQGMINAVLDVKSVFSGAYIRRGGEPVTVGVFA
ncbi:MAG: toprim domain-containing protein, partial [Proteobacteria bacterium]|nr:toprim domain-containing protein [Pseudomonadota bacterium]